MPPFSLRFARQIGRQEFDAAIDTLRADLKGNRSDLASHEMIAHCHRWAGRADAAIAACHEALNCDPASFDSHAMLAQLLAEKSEFGQAAFHARKGLELYPEPLPKIPRFLTFTFSVVSRLIPRLRNAGPLSLALERVESERAEWVDWAKRYLSWYDQSSDSKVKPAEH